MRLYLIRHAHAVDAGEDPERPLSAKGRKQVKRLAEFLKETAALEPEEIWHSPLLRSQQTARLLAKRLKLDAPLFEIDGLEPEDDPREMAMRLAANEKLVAIIGHEPHLSGLAARLVVAPPKTSPFVLRKSSVLALERARSGRRERWVVRWQMSPELLP